MQAFSMSPSPHHTTPSSPRHEDWLHIPYWTRDSWLPLRRGVSKPPPGTNVSTLYLVDEEGQPVSKGIQDAVHSDVQKFWIDELKKPETASQLGPFSQVGLQMREKFRAKIEGLHPWLRLCEGHWKVEQLWHDGWTSFARPLSRGIPRSTAGKKRPKTNDEEDISDAPNKRSKGKGVDREPIPAPSPPPCPKLIKMSMKVVKVGTPYDLCYHHMHTDRVVSVLRCNLVHIHAVATILTSHSSDGVRVTSTISLPTSPQVRNYRVVRTANIAHT